MVCCALFHRHCVGMRHIQPRGVSVVLVDKDVVFVDALVSYCALRDPTLRITPAEPSSTDLHRSLITNQPDIVTIDPDQIEDPARLLNLIYGRVPNTRVMIVTLAQSSALAATLASAGALGWVGKDEPGIAFIEAVHAVHEGQARFPQAYLGAVMQMLLGHTRAAIGSSQRDVRALSDREREILSRVLAGATSRDIARQLHLSTSTIRSHRRRIGAKLGL
jgi:DNA-binding NarL/FixJ family response regulator